jgi:hypothetical protein
MNPEADEISPEDLEAAAEVWDRLAKEVRENAETWIFECDQDI